MTNVRNADWDPRAASLLADQDAAYDAMRERCPVAYSHFLGWSVFPNGWAVLPVRVG